ncbi:hypothetical protein TUMSATVNIG1_29280 [Vibrio nigripulchritudo]|nr:hypothetical protein VNTUMSATTG_29000 [Vibrio nigripulchritudo]BDU32319.1 hypothetical protein TUMSATVNIG1_29280 [Vibrio nigripulchritudo]
MTSKVVLSSHAISMSLEVSASFNAWRVWIGFIRFSGLKIKLVTGSKEISITDPIRRGRKYVNQINSHIGLKELCRMLCIGLLTT